MVAATPAVSSRVANGVRMIISSQVVLMVRARVSTRLTYLKMS
jgi:hypothetical protein